MEYLIGIILRRPVAVTAFYALIIALATIASLRLPITLLPSIDYPTLVVWTGIQSVPPARVEREVTSKIEEAVAGSTGLVRLTSRSQLGGSVVRMDFNWNSDLDLAALEVRQQLDRVVSILPGQAERPVVLRVDPSDRPIMTIAVTSALSGSETEREQSKNLVRLRRISHDVIARRLEQLNGVARVQVTGGYDQEIEIVVNTDRMESFGIELPQITRALQDANVALPGGTVKRGPFSYSVEVSGEFRNRADVAATIISKPGKPTVDLSDVATIRTQMGNRRGLVRLDGQETLLLLVERRPDANAVKTAASVREVLAALSLEHPGLKLDVVVDESLFIRAAIADVLKAVIWGGLLAMCVLLFFLRRPRALAAVVLAVPLSLAATLVLFDLFKVSLNLIALSGLALGVGMLVDNAIVVVENIARLRDQGFDAASAAHHGASEVALAITTSTMTTLAVFLPLSFVEGLGGRLFRDQSLAVACSLVASLVVALTVVPLVVSRERNSNILGRSVTQQPWLIYYEAFLTRCLNHRTAVIGIIAVFLSIAGVFAWKLPRETVPSVEQGRVMVQLEMHPETDLALLAERSAAIESTFSYWPEVQQVLADLGEREQAQFDLAPRPPYKGDLTVVLTSGSQVSDFLARLRSLELPADLSLQAKPVHTELEILLHPGEADLAIDLISEQWEVAADAATNLIRDIEKRPELANIGLDSPLNIPVYDLDFDQDAMVRFGIRPEDLGATIEASTVAGLEVTRLVTVNNQIPIVVYAEGGRSIAGLLAQRVSGAFGHLPLGTFIKADLVRQPTVLIRSDQANVIRILVDVARGADLKRAVSAIEESFKILPAAVRGRVGGANEAFRIGLHGVVTSLLLSSVLVYLILAAQFESLLQPLVILSVIPLAMGGVTIALALTQQSWNLMSFTGCVVLVGIAVNDAIVKVDFINRARQRGLSILRAVRAASRGRLRPILMTTLTTSLGLLPLAFSAGQGASLRAPMAISIVGGLICSTLLTLSAVPVIYTLVISRAGFSKREL